MYQTWETTTGARWSSRTTTFKPLSRVNSWVGCGSAAKAEKGRQTVLSKQACGAAGKSIHSCLNLLGCPLGLSVGGREGARITVRFTGGHAYRAFYRPGVVWVPRRNCRVCPLIPAFSPMMPYQSFEKIDFEVSLGRLDKMLRVNKLDETQSVQH